MHGWFLHMTAWAIIISQSFQKYEFEGQKDKGKIDEMWARKSLAPYITRGWHNIELLFDNTIPSWQTRDDCALKKNIFSIFTFIHIYTYVYIHIYIHTHTSHIHIRYIFRQYIYICPKIIQIKPRNRKLLKEKAWEILES